MSPSGGNADNEKARRKKSKKASKERKRREAPQEPPAQGEPLAEVVIQPAVKRKKLPPKEERGELPLSLPTPGSSPEAEGQEISKPDILGAGNQQAEHKKSERKAGKEMQRKLALQKSSSEGEPPPHKGGEAADQPLEESLKEEHQGEGRKALDPNLARPEEAQSAENQLQLSKSSIKKGGKKRPALPWMRVPLEIEDGMGVPISLVQGLNARLQDAVRNCKYNELYPVQAAAWQVLAGGMSQAHDLCICAPTGSGKTLAYALPILQRLTGRAKHLLGALVVLPTRELAVQVYSVFTSLAPAVGLSTGLAAARLSLSAEAAALAETPVNLLIATPGRLVAHLKAPRPPFTLNGLQFLVVDETDRLLRQAYQDWLPLVESLTATAGSLEGQHAGLWRSHSPLASRVVKILASATLTQDPAKIQRLRLYSPRYIAMSSTDHRYKVPKQLKQYRLIGATSDKPILLMAVLHCRSQDRTVIFTGSLVATHRLYTLLHEIPSLQSEVVEYSSLRSSKNVESPGLAAFRAGKARILVASDALTRGMDLPGVDLVISYDPAAYAKIYVHRAGRTARAGKEGAVVTLLSADQVRHYKAMLRKVDNTCVVDFTLPPKLVNRLRPEFQQAMQRAGVAEGDG